MVSGVEGGGIRRCGGFDLINGILSVHVGLGPGWNPNISVG